MAQLIDEDKLHNELVSTAVITTTRQTITETVPTMDVQQVQLSSLPNTLGGNNLSINTTSQVQRSSLPNTPGGNSSLVSVTCEPTKTGGAAAELTRVSGGAGAFAGGAVTRATDMWIRCGTLANKVIPAVSAFTEEYPPYTSQLQRMLFDGSNAAYINSHPLLPYKLPFDLCQFLLGCKFIATDEIAANPAELPEYVLVASLGTRKKQGGPKQQQGNVSM
jgi:hypothetical protein